MLHQLQASRASHNVRSSQAGLSRNQSVDLGANAPPRVFCRRYDQVKLRLKSASDMFRRLRWLTHQAARCDCLCIVFLGHGHLKEARKRQSGLRPKSCRWHLAAPLPAAPPRRQRRFHGLVRPPRARRPHARRAPRTCSGVPGKRERACVTSVPCSCRWAWCIGWPKPTAKLGKRRRRPICCTSRSASSRCSSHVPQPAVRRQCQRYFAPVQPMKKLRCVPRFGAASWAINRLAQPMACNAFVRESRCLPSACRGGAGGKPGKRVGCRRWERRPPRVCRGNRPLPLALTCAIAPSIAHGLSCVLQVCLYRAFTFGLWARGASHLLKPRLHDESRSRRLRHVHGYGREPRIPP